ncbi:MAG: hypothetical protein ACYC4L_01950 [Chloroflexota bacterium]
MVGLLVDWQRTAPMPPLEFGPPAEAVLGDTRQFWVQDAQTTGYRRAEASLAARTESAYFYVETDLAIDKPALARSAQQFENVILPSLTPVFGALDRPGPDGERRLTVLLARLPSGLAGYHSGFDELPSWVHPHSNERHIIYLRGDGSSPTSAEFGALLAHEAQHLLHWLHKPEADNWISEGLSELAKYIVGHSPRQSAAAFLNAPNTQLTAWASNSAEMAQHYGAGYLFLRYFSEQFGREALARLLSEAGRGADLFDNYFAKLDQPHPRFDDIFGDWVVANLLDDDTLAGGRYGYKSEVLRVSSMPSLRSGDTTTSWVSQYAARYYALPASPRPQVLDFSGTDSARILPTQPHGGEHFWWSNRGDVMHSSLTVGADLRHTQQAHLQFWAWYDLEQDYDFAYLQVSTDEGRSWTVLQGQHTTSSNRTGNNLAAGWTGRSGGGREPEWILEEVDLSGFAGNQVLLRFSYVTDDGFLGDGFALDDLEIPELGLKDGAEAVGDWQADGFVRTDNLVPQEYRLWLVRQGEVNEVTRLSLDDRKRLTAVVPAITTPGERWVLAIAPLAPLTTQPAPISLSLHDSAIPR